MNYQKEENVDFFLSFFCRTRRDDSLVFCFPIQEGYVCMYGVYIYIFSGRKEEKELPRCKKHRQQQPKYFIRCVSSQEELVVSIYSYL